MKKHYWILIITFLFSLFNFPKLQAQSDRMKDVNQKLSNIEIDTIKLDSLLAWATYSEETSIADAIQINTIGRTLASDLKLADWVATFDFALGKAYLGFGNQDSSFYHLERALEFYEISNMPSKMASVYNKKIRLFINTGEFDKAYTSGDKALKIYKSLNKPLLKAGVLSELSDVLYYQNRYEEGFKIAKQALEIHERLSNITGIIDANQYLADHCIGLDKYEEALDYIDKALKLQRTLGKQSIALGSILNSRGNVFKYLERYELALEDYQKCKVIVVQYKHSVGIAATNANIADVYMRMGKFEKALPIKLESIALQEKNKSNNSLLENYRHTSEIYDSLNNTEKAFLYFKKYTTLKDSVLSIEKNNAVSQLKIQYETEKNESTIALQNQKIKQQKNMQKVFIGFLSLLGILLAILYRNYTNKQRFNQQLQVTNDALDAKNQQNELLLKEIHHRVKNNLQTISSLLNLQSNSIEDPNALDAVKESQNRVASMALIHQKLYQGENLAAIEMRDYFETIGRSIISSFKGIYDAVELKIDMPEIELDVDTAIPIGLITNELLTNSMKYAFIEKGHGKIYISMQKDENNLIQLKITDNGKNDSTKIDESGTGFGSMLVNLLTTQLGGQLEQSTTDGTATIIKFPLKEAA